MLGVTVQGGTNAGRKRPKVAQTWTHPCTKHKPVTLTAYSCPDCGARRPT